jgi:mannose-6-phosphate isomerase-like protein (cupin superfamily)
MQIIHSDAVFRVQPGTSPDYNKNNPLLRVLGLIEKLQLAAEREFYVSEHLQYLIPYDSLELYGPNPPNENVLDPTQQDFKTDFQKQNVRDFRTTDTHLVRGLVNAGNWIGPFVRLSYRGGPDSKLSAEANHNLGQSIKTWVKVGSAATTSLVTVPYNEASDRYEVELWGFPGEDLNSQLDEKGRTSLQRGEIQARTDLIKGSINDFRREDVSDLYMIDVSPDNTMHPVLPLHIEVAWTDSTEQFWDSNDGANYQYEFNMIVRGWDHYLGVGMSPNPHGGIGFLEYRNLLSNYGRYTRRRELFRRVEPWMFDAFGQKSGQVREENFMAVDYMDLHIMKPNCGIGLHRHRDNQEIFLMMEGRGYMVIGDWCKMPERERCFEVRTLRPGHFAMLKGGNLHGLMNALDEDASLFMFGGYD